MSDRVEQISKSELLNVIRSEHKRLEETLAQLSEDPMTQPGVAGEWSVKDILVHITAWEKRMVRWVGETLRGEVPETPAPGMTWDDLDKLNEQTYLENRNKPLGQVLADFHQSYQATVNYRTVERCGLSLPFRTVVCAARDIRSWCGSGLVHPRAVEQVDTERTILCSVSKPRATLPTVPFTFCWKPT
jgi:hypothetical protein